MWRTWRELREPPCNDLFHDIGTWISASPLPEVWGELRHPGTVSTLIQFLISVLSPIQALALAIRYVLVVVQSRPPACLTRRISAGRMRVLANTTPLVPREISCVRCKT